MHFMTAAVVPKWGAAHLRNAKGQKVLQKKKCSLRFLRELGLEAGAMWIWIWTQRSQELMLCEQQMSADASPCDCSKEERESDPLKRLLQAIHESWD